MNKQYFLSLFSTLAVALTLSGCWDKKQDEANAIQFNSIQCQSNRNHQL